MKDYDVLNEDNFVMFAMKHYNNPCCLGINEFYDDLKRTNFLKRLFNRFVNTGELKDRLILNHLIIFYNVFEPKVATKILFYRIPKQFWPQLKTFLLYLSFMPDIIYGVSEKPIVSSEIPLDQKIVDYLRSI